MRHFEKRFVAVCTVVLLLFGTAVPCAAAPLGSLTVRLEAPVGTPQEGLTVRLCQVATYSGGSYYPASGFEDSGISIAGIVNDPSAQNAKQVLRYIDENDVASLSAVSAGGRAYFELLESGIWIAYVEADQPYEFDPFFVLLPMKLDGHLHYDIISTPKMQENIPNDQAVYVVKRWDDRDNAANKRPDRIVVDLLCNGEWMDTAVLNAENGWAYTFTDLPDGQTYTVSEQAVADYQVQYSGDATNGFVITNTYVGDKLPQTGQLWWPIALLAVAGVALTVLGILDIKGKRHDEKAE